MSLLSRKCNMAHRTLLQMTTKRGIRTTGATTTTHRFVAVPTEKATYTALKDMTKDDWFTCCAAYNVGVMRRVSQTLIELLESQRGNEQNDKRFGLPVDLYQHQLQAATRAHKDGASEEIIVMALFHDAAEYLAPYNHAQAIAKILYPYLSPKSYWILSHHDIFQSYYYLHHYGTDSDEFRSKFKHHPYYEDTIYFCNHYDQNSFDDSYKSFEIEFFHEMVLKFFNQEPFWWNDGVDPITGAGKLMTVS